MAQEEIKLVGVFRDEITPKLKKLNKEINAVTKSFGKMRQKLQPIAQDFKKIGDAVERVGDGIARQNNELKEATGIMSRYRTQVRRTLAEQRKLGGAMRVTRPGDGSARSRRAQGLGGGRSRGGGIGDMAIGGTIAGIMTRAITEGFRIGVQMMMAPFKAFAGAFAERMGDEMADIQSAGGMYALDKKSKNPIFKGFDDARAMQERLNASLATSAAALPGATNDYVRAARGVTDTVMMAFGKNEEAFKSFAVELGAKEGATSEEAITKVLSRFTEQTVLLGMGGAKGGMPLTMLMEQLVTQEGVNVQSMKRRYAQLRQNPLLATMLEDAQAEINATGVGTAERIKAVMKALDNALPQEVVNAMRRSMEGLVEATRSAFFDPDTGLLGLSRKLEYTFENEAGEIIKETDSLFNVIRDILANVFVPLMELFAYLPSIFDPFTGAISSLARFRDATKNFFGMFESFTKFFEEAALEMHNAGNTRQANLLKQQAGGRGALAAINQLMSQFGTISREDYQANLDRIHPEDLANADLEAPLSDIAISLLKQFAGSDMIKDLVNAIGEALGNIVKNFAKLLEGGLDSLDDGIFSDLINGFMAGFNKGLAKTDVKGIITKALRKAISFITKIFMDDVAPVLWDGFMTAIGGVWESGPAGQMAVIGVSLLALGKVISVFSALMGPINAVFGAFQSGAIAAGIAKIGALLPPVALALGTILLLGGGLEGTMRQLTDFFAETFATLGGIFSGLIDTLGVIFGLTNDLITAFGGLFGMSGEAANGLDMLKIALAPLTLAFQLIEMGLRGLAESLAWARMQLTLNPGERKKRREEYEDLKRKRGESQGRINAYNASMQGITAQRKMLNDAIAEINSGKSKDIARVAELTSFVQALQKTMATKDPELAKALEDSAKPLNEAAQALRDTTKAVSKTSGSTIAKEPLDVAGISKMLEQKYGVKAEPIQTAELTAPLKGTENATKALKGPTDKTAAATEATKVEVAKLDATTKNIGNEVKTSVDSAKAGIESKLDALSGISPKLDSILSELKSGLNVKMTGMVPGAMGGAQGGPSMFNDLATMSGLVMTSGYRPGDSDSYHGIDRARDYAGPANNMMMFANTMASMYGGSLKELIYTPMGFSIKNGQRVPPYAQDTHYDHVHVAYGMGPGQPAFFNSQKEAQNWEKKVAPKNTAVQSVTSNSGEMGGGNTFNINVTGGGSAQETAEIVAQEIVYAIQKSTYNELYTS